jgi:hypothetical protein
LLDANTYHINNYDEANSNQDYNALLVKAEKININFLLNIKMHFLNWYYTRLKPVPTCRTLYHAVAYNKWFAAQKALPANMHADNAKQFYIKDSLISIEYNKIANGKWNHMMDQTHIGYTYWQQPPVNRMPDVQYVPADSAREQATLIRGKATTAEDNIPKNSKGEILSMK